MLKNIIRIAWIGFVGGFVGLIFWVFAVSFNLFGIFGGMPDLTELENPRNMLASELYSADGKILGKYFREDRDYMDYKKISPNLINALLATEDVRYYEHSGIDLKGTLSIFYYLLKGERRGASTISQQLAKNLFNTREEGLMGIVYDVPLFSTLTIKTKEWILAIELERGYTKEEIMSLYLTTVDFGRNAFGLKVASKRYFNTSPDSLTVPQAAVLVGMLKAPTRYNPSIKGSENRALRRRNTVIEQMVKYNFLTEADAQKYKKEPIALNMQEENQNMGVATYFRTAVRNELIGWCKNNGYDLFGDGLQIYTTIDSRMQQHAEDAVNEYMPVLQKQFFKEWKGRNPWVDKNYKELKGYIERKQKETDRYKLLYKEFDGDSVQIAKVMHTPIPMSVFTWQNPTYEKDTVMSPYDSIRYYKHFLHTGIMAMDPHTGQIKAWVGGVNHKYFKWDNVRQTARQPGSTFKPIVYMVAVKEHGFSPCDLVYDSPQTFVLDQGRTWTPKNSGGGYSNRQMTLRQALAQSVNSVAAYLMKKTKPINVVKYAKQLGIMSPLDTVPALCLGSSNVSVFELTGAYATFANRGQWYEPHFITMIKDKSGKIIYRKQPKSTQPLNEEHAYMMIHLLKGSSEERGGTAWGLHRYNFRKENEIAAKTGTTNSQSDGWFMGTSKDLTVGVRVGGEESSIHFRSMYWGQGSHSALPIFAGFMERVYKDSTLGYEKGKFAKPENLKTELDCGKYRHLPQGDSVTYILPTSPYNKGGLN